MKFANPLSSLCNFSSCLLGFGLFIVLCFSLPCSSYHLYSGRQPLRSVMPGLRVLNSQARPCSTTLRSGYHHDRSSLRSHAFYLSRSCPRSAYCPGCPRHSLGLLRGNHSPKCLHSAHHSCKTGCHGHAGDHLTIRLGRSHHFGGSSRHQNPLVGFKRSFPRNHRVAL